MATFSDADDSGCVVSLGNQPGNGLARATLPSAPLPRQPLRSLRIPSERQVSPPRMVARAPGPLNRERQAWGGTRRTAVGHRLSHSRWVAPSSGAISWITHDGEERLVLVSRGI